VGIYQKECESLRLQFVQKDVFIERLRTEKATMVSERVSGCVCMFVCVYDSMTVAQVA